jgi:hypothetical protein
VELLLSAAGTTVLLTFSLLVMLNPPFELDDT